jgi:hypothetical protein
MAEPLPVFQRCAVKVAAAEAQTPEREMAEMAEMADFLERAEEGAEEQLPEAGGVAETGRRG